MTDLVDGLLRSPRGRFLCAHVGFACTTVSSPRWRDYPTDPADVREALASVDVSRVADLSDVQLLDILGFTTDCARYWQEPDEDDIIYATADVVALLRPIAHTLLATPQVHWWRTPVDLTAQRRIAYPFPNETLPTSTLPYRSDNADLDRWRTHTTSREDHARADTARRNAARISDEWWSIPLPSACVATSRAHPQAGAVQVVAEEDTAIGDVVRVWPVTVLATPRIFEITTPADWAYLVATYPLEVTESKRWDWYRTIGAHHRWFIPDWAAVATDYDGVHLTVWGYLCTAGIATAVDEHDGASVLAGWDPDATWWLNLDTIHIDDVPTLCRRTGDYRWAPTP